MRGDAAEPAEDSAGSQPNILWLNGLPGSGKTTIASSVAQQCHASGTLGASFFCSRSDTDCSNASLIFTTIAYHLGLFYEPFKEQVAEILRKDPRLVYSSVSRQFEELIIRPLKHLRDGFPSCVVVIDALDECRDPQVTSAVISTLLKHAEDLSPLRFFVTSRPERHIVTRFDTIGYRNAFGKLLLHEVEVQLVTVDIGKYFTASLSEIRQYFNMAESWPDKSDIETLSRMANGLFIFAATAIKFIADRDYNDPAGQLKILTSAGSHRLLDQLYLQVLDTAFPSISTGLLGRVKTVLGSIAVIKDPLPPSGLSRLLELPTDTVYSSLVGLHSVLVVPAAQESVANIRIIHPTFPEFLLDSSRCTSRSFVVNSQRQNTLLLRRCLGALKGLKQDICGIRDPSLLNVEVPGLLGRIESAIPAHLRYASRHWCTHLVNGELSDEILDALVEFVQGQLLHWIEVCSLVGVLRDGVDDDRARDIVILLNDCERLVVGYFPAISSSALHLYYSLLSFIPTKTALARTYAHECFSEISVKVFGSVPGMWDACLGTVTAHGGDSVTAVDFSLDGRTIASPGRDGRIRIWDALTCALLSVLPGHSSSVNSVKYSPDGARIASAAVGGTVKIWDAVSGVLIRTLKGHAGYATCAAFTPDGGRIVSGFRNCSLKIWDADTGACLVTLTAHDSHVISIAVSRDGRDVLACAADKTVLVWDFARGEIRQALSGHTKDVTSVAYNHDGT
ncbi:uncharacterized protein PHACADRAFT_131855, partial [Phanerochaete carnosa HHB-10118-sp]